MFLKGSIVSFICLVWFIVHDRRARRRKSAPSNTTVPDDSGRFIPKEDADELLERHKETCRSVEALVERRKRCERTARERSERLGTDFDTELNEELKKEFA